MHFVAWGVYAVITLAAWRALGHLAAPHDMVPRAPRNPWSDVFGRLWWDRPAFTIRTEFYKPEKGQYLHPRWVKKSARRKSPSRDNRVITHLEASRLQDFPRDFLWCGTKVEIAKQIGNAVPGGLAAAIARQLRQRLD